MMNATMRMSTASRHVNCSERTRSYSSWPPPSFDGASQHFQEIDGLAHIMHAHDRGPPRWAAATAASDPSARVGAAERVR